MPSIYSHRLGVAVDNKYGFLVLRAFQGISAAMTIPSAYHLIVHLFPEKDKQQVSRITLYLHLILTILPFAKNSLALLGLIAAIANTLGVVL
jgi:MFS family permease